mmetsp:Transcript_23747/g.70492  ORF Transcript_23747/g.70492 Transcript_23747/m.70492 type:complete len:225 (+) Transcript_23747:1365-2039(+)
MLATTDSIAPACSSRCVNARPGEPLCLPSGHAMHMLFCSSVPISSTAPVATWRTGRTMRAACVKRKSPGKGPPCSGRMSASSRCIGTCSSPGRSESSSSGSAAELLAIACTAALMARRRATTMGADAERTLPTSRPSRVTGRYSGGGGGVVAGAHGTMPRDARICTSIASVSCGSSGPCVMILQAAAKWLRRPQGLPSGVCTGHMKPQDSGSSLRTVVVRSSAK